MPDRLSRMKVELVYLTSFHSSRFLNITETFTGDVEFAWKSEFHITSRDRFFRIVHSHNFVGFDVNRFDGTKRIGRGGGGNIRWPEANL